VRVINKISEKFFRLKKNCHQLMIMKSMLEYKKIIFILGCQRSGTSMLLDVFYKDIDIKTYKESESIFFGEGDKHLRLRNTQDVMGIVSKEKSNVIVAKPLLDSQLASDLLSDYDNSYGIWIYRHYKDVASSNLKRFGEGNGHKDMRYISEMIESDWRGERVSDTVRNVVAQLYSADRSNIDAAALFWYVRNSLYFDLALDKSDQVLLCNYEALVKKPAEVMSDMYRYLGLGKPPLSITKGIHSGSSGKGKTIALSEDVESLCEALLSRLNACVQQKTEAVGINEVGL